MKEYIYPNPKKEFSLDIPIEKIANAIKNIRIVDKKYELISSNELFNQYTLDIKGFMMTANTVEINLNAVSENKTEVTIEVTPDIHGFKNQNRLMDGQEHITIVANNISKFLTLSNEEVEGIKSQLIVEETPGDFDSGITLILLIFFGVFGIHRFYTKNYMIGLFQLFTLGGFFIWVFIDFLLIISGSYRDVYNKKLNSMKDKEK